MCNGAETKMSDINIRIGKKLQKIRESKNLSLNDVGLRVGKARNRKRRKIKKLPCCNRRVITMRHCKCLVKEPSHKALLRTLF